MKNGNVIKLNLLHLNSCHFNGTEKVQKGSAGGGSIVIPPPPVEPEPTPTYTLSASVANGMVSATRNGSAVNLPYTANEGDVIVVEVTPNDGYAFEGWADGNTDNPRSITMNADVALSAQCVEVVQPPVGNYIQFEDKAVEAICVANWSSDGIGLTEEDAAAVTSIGTTFKGNTEITSFDEFRYFTGVNTLDRGAFEGCSNLASLPIEHIVKLNDNALYGCTALAYDNLNLVNCTSFGIGVLYGVKVKKLSLGKVTTLYQGGRSKQNYGDKTILEELVIPIGVVSIPRYCFEGYSNAHIVLHEGITSIGSQALYGTATRGDVVLPNLTSMEGSVFAGSKIKRVLDLGSITNLGNRTFNDCDSLEYINMPATLTEIGQYTFSSNATPMVMVVRASTPPTLGTTFTSSTITAIYVPDASLEAYKTATNWNTYADRIHPLSEIEGSPYIQFEDAEVERVLMANGVSSDGIGITKEDAANVTSIETWFKENNTIQTFDELKYFTNVKDTSASAFIGCTALQWVNCENIESINSQVFNNSGITELILPKVTAIHNSGLVGMKKVTKVVIGASCTKIDANNIWSWNDRGNVSFIFEGATPLIFSTSNNKPDWYGVTFYVPDVSVDAYKSAWSSWASRIKGISEYNG